jgi:rhodanese-related sulfurtransferase
MALRGPVPEPDRWSTDTVAPARGGGVGAGVETTPNSAAGGAPVSLVPGPDRPAAQPPGTAVPGSPPAPGQPVASPPSVPPAPPAAGPGPGSQLPDISAIPQPPMVNMGRAEVDTPLAYSHWLTRDALFVDARSAQEFAAGHIPGAINIPPDQVRGGRNPEALARFAHMREKQVIVYCGGGACDASKEVAQELFGRSFLYMAVYTSGMQGWRTYPGLPVQTGSQP